MKYSLYEEFELIINPIYTVYDIKLKLNKDYLYPISGKIVTIDGKWFLDQTKLCYWIVSNNSDVNVRLNFLSLKAN